MRVSYVTHSPGKTRALAKLFADETLRTEKGKGALIIAFVGDLGTGKTTFVKSFIRSLGAPKRVTSPTFLILRRFPLPEGRFENVFHIDAFRVGVKDIKALGVEKILEDPKNVVLIEWADRIRAVVPKGAIWVRLKHGKTTHERHIAFTRR